MDSFEGENSNHNHLHRWQFSLYDLLVVIGVVAVVLAWPSIACFCLSLVGAACGIRFAWRRRTTGALEAIMGAIVGGLSGTIVSLIEAYTGKAPFEDSGLGFFGVSYAGYATGGVHWSDCWRGNLARSNRLPRGTFSLSSLGLFLHVRG